MKNLINKALVVIADIPFVKRDAEWKAVRMEGKSNEMGALAHGMYLQGCRAVDRSEKTGNTQEMMLGNCYLAAGDRYLDRFFEFSNLSADLNNPAKRIGALYRYHQAGL